MFITISRFNKAGHTKKKNTTDYEALPSEAKYFVDKYKIDPQKVNYKGMLKLIALVLGIDIALVAVPILLIIKNEILQMILGTIIMIPVYLLSLKILGRYFKKKGLVKNV